MSKHVAPDAALSPKFTAAVAVGIGLVALQAVLTALTPEMFDWAGEFSPVLYSLITAVGATVAAYLKGDPLRAIGGAAVQVGETPTGLPHPEAVPAEDYTSDADALAALAAARRQGGA